MLSLRRVATLIGLLLVAGLLFTAWEIWQVQRDLTRAESNATELMDAISAQDQSGSEQASERLSDAAASAADRTDGFWWGALTHLPVFGDDADGIRAVSVSLDQVAEDGVPPLVDHVDELDRITADGGVDLDTVRNLQAPVAQAAAAFDTGYARVAGLDSSGYSGVFKTQFETYVDRLEETTAGLHAAEKAFELLPDFFGGQAPRRYLLVFQNNAEIRATGGLPGAWAELSADDGRLELVQQGTARDFPHQARSVLPLSQGEGAVYTNLLGVYVQDANFTPDFPRAAELMAAHWALRFPDRELDGVISVDPVALSYVLQGTGPVSVDGRTIDEENAVFELLSRPYLELDPPAQDEFFASAARAIFDATTAEPESPVDLVRGLSRAADERRLLIASFDASEAQELAGTRVIGGFDGDQSTDPSVFVGLNDGTASKMSYYLRYRADVQARACTGGVQTLIGTMGLNQTITKAEARELPESVTGEGAFGYDKGSQVVVVRIYGPVSGEIADVKFDGKRVDFDVAQLDNRPVVTLYALLSGPDDVVITWSMLTGADQTGDGTVRMTPSIVPGSKDSTFRSAC